MLGGREGEPQPSAYQTKGYGVVGHKVSISYLCNKIDTG